MRAVVCGGRSCYIVARRLCQKGSHFEGRAAMEAYIQGAHFTPEAGPRQLHGSVVLDLLDEVTNDSESSWSIITRLFAHLDRIGLQRSPAGREPPVSAFGAAIRGDSYLCWQTFSSRPVALYGSQVASVEGRNFEAVSVGNRIRGTSFDAVSAKNTSVVIDVINLGVALCAAHAMLSRILRRLNINAVRRTGRRAQKTGDALFQSILIALQNVHATKTFLQLGAAERSRPVRIVLHLRGLEHLHKGDAHALGDGGDVLQNCHT